MRKRVNIFHWVGGFFTLKKNLLIYIEKSADFRLSSKKGRFPFFFFSLVLPIENIPCSGFWCFLFHSFYVRSEPSTTLSSEQHTETSDSLVP